MSPKITFERRTQDEKKCTSKRVCLDSDGDDRSQKSIALASKHSQPKTRGEQSFIDEQAYALSFRHIPLGDPRGADHNPRHSRNSVFSAPTISEFSAREKMREMLDAFNQTEALSARAEAEGNPVPNKMTNKKYTKIRNAAVTVLKQYNDEVNLAEAVDEIDEMNSGDEWINRELRRKTGGLRSWCHMVPQVEDLAWYQRLKRPLLQGELSRKEFPKAVEEFYAAES